MLGALLVGPLLIPVLHEDVLDLHNQGLYQLEQLCKKRGTIYSFSLGLPIFLMMVSILSEILAYPQ